MFCQVRKYKSFITAILIASFCFSALAKDLHEICVKHQHISCLDQPDSSFTHLHTTEHSLHDCKLSNFVIAPIIGINPVHGLFTLRTEYFQSVFYHSESFSKALNNTDPSRGPPYFRI